MEDRQQNNEVKDLTQKTALAYIRISDKKQKDGESPNNQRRAIREYAEKYNIKIIEWFYDEAKSGKNTDREELQNLLKLAMRYKGKIDYVIVYKMNRASRDINTYITGMRAILQSKGISVRSATEPIDDSPMGNFMESLYVMVGQLDNENKRETVVDNMRSIALQGYWQHGPMIGYNSVKVKNGEGKLRPSLKANTMGDKVIEVLLRFNRGNINPAELSRYADTIKLRSMYDQKLSQEMITRLIKRPEYAGYVHDKYTKYELVDGKHDGLITPAVYWQNMKILERKRNLSIYGLGHKTMNPLYPLRKFLKCPSCKRPLTSAAPNNSPRYYCPRCKGNGSLMTDKTHKLFISLLQTIEPKPNTLKLYKEILLRVSVKELGNLNKDIATIRRKLDSLGEERTTILRKYALDKLGEAEKDDLIDAIDTEKLDLNNQLLKLEEQQTLKEADIEYAFNFMGNVAKIWGDAPLELKFKFQNLVFPKGLELDIKNDKFITSEISPLYGYVPSENEPLDAKNSMMVTPRRIELLLPG